MRVAAIAYVSKTLEEAELLAKYAAAYKSFVKFGYSHSNGIKSAKAVAGTIFLALEGGSKEQIRTYLKRNYGFHFALNSIRDGCRLDKTCGEKLPAFLEYSNPNVLRAIEAFLTSSSFEDAIQNAVVIDGNSSAIACITGAIAEAYYKKIPTQLRTMVLNSVFSSKNFPDFSPYPDLYPPINADPCGGPHLYAVEESGLTFSSYSSLPPCTDVRRLLRIDKNGRLLREYLDFYICFVKDVVQPRLHKA